MSTPGPRQIDNWRDAEDNAAEWMRAWGFRDAVVTGGGADGGVDVRSKRAIAQVKFQAAQVGRPALQRLIGARMQGAETLIFFTGANYARPAIEYADAMGIALFKYDLLGRMTPINSHARTVASRTRDATAASKSTKRRLSDSQKEALAAHARRHWAAWLALVFFVGPLGSLFDSVEQAPGGMFSGPGWLDGLELLGFWCAGAALVWLYLRQRRSATDNGSTARPQSAKPSPRPETAVSGWGSARSNVERAQAEIDRLRANAADQSREAD